MFKLNPTTGELDLVNPSGSSGDVNIPQLDSDPVSPDPEEAWVLRTAIGGAGGGKLKFLFGLGQPITTSGGATNKYELSYRTLEGTTKRVELT